jgi:peptide deformylase
MAIRDTLQAGDPRLKAKNKKITRFNDSKVQKVIKDLIDTMHHNQLIGMAAQQIGENLKLFVTEPRQTASRPADQTDILRVYLNPTITWISPEQVTIFEGCGSVAYGTLFAPVTRPKTITIEYQDQAGTSHWLKCDGILSRVIQHEYDHLQGIEFTEKIDDYKMLMAKEWYLEYSKSHPELIEDTRITIKQSDKVE